VEPARDVVGALPGRVLVGDPQANAIGGSEETREERIALEKLFWEAHRVMWDEEYWHLENLMNLEQIGRPFGFQLCVLPIKWMGTTAAPVRAIAIVED
jgi:kynurenine formamidase